jgi:hypothetical protein
VCASTKNMPKQRESLSFTVAPGSVACPFPDRLEGVLDDGVNSLTGTGHS